jgi:hypothetical protein
LSIDAKKASENKTQQKGSTKQNPFLFEFRY